MSDETKTCPICGETTNANLEICEQCGCSLSVTEQPNKTKVESSPNHQSSSSLCDEIQRQSFLGIGSLVLSNITGVLIFITFTMVRVIDESTPGGFDEDSVLAGLLGLFLLGLLFSAFCALGLGIGGVVQRKKGKLAAVIGIISSIEVFLYGVLS